MKRLTALIITILFVSAGCNSNSPVSNSDTGIGQKVDSLLSIMTLEEKIGQLTLYTSDMDQTGAFLRPEYLKDVRSGSVGAIFNAYGAEYTCELQEMAVNETRLGIPLLFGYDVIHGHRTIFPVPLAETARVYNFYWREFTRYTIVGVCFGVARGA